MNPPRQKRPSFMNQAFELTGGLEVMSLPRLLATGDVEKLTLLPRTCWLDTYTGLLPDSVIQTAITVWQSKESILTGLQNPQAFYSGYFEGGELAGMVSAGRIDENTVKIFQLYVLPSHQRKGIGSKLMDAAIQHFRGVAKVVLEVEEGNKKGISFYKKYGFTYPRKTVVKIAGEEIPCLYGELHAQ